MSRGSGSPLASAAFLRKLEAIERENEGRETEEESSQPPISAEGGSVVRRASISGGSPTQVRVSRHLERKSSLHPRHSAVAWPSSQPPASSASSEDEDVFPAAPEEDEEGLLPVDQVVDVIEGAELTRLQALLLTDRANSGLEWSRPLPLPEALAPTHSFTPPHAEASLRQQMSTVVSMEEDDEWDDEAYVDLGREKAASEGPASAAKLSATLNLASSSPSPDLRRLTKQDSSSSFQSLPDKSRAKIRQIFGTTPSDTPPSTPAKFGSLPGRGRGGVEWKAWEAESLVEAADCPAESLDPSEMRGWLWRGRLPAEAEGAKWRKRWVVLKGPLIFIFKTASDSRAEGLISLHAFDAKVPAPGTYRGSKKYVLQLASTSSKVSYLFHCESAQTRALWLRHIGGAKIQFPPAHAGKTRGSPSGGTFWRLPNDSPQPPWTPLARILHHTPPSPSSPGMRF